MRGEKPLAALPVNPAVLSLSVLRKELHISAVAAKQVSVCIHVFRRGG